MVECLLANPDVVTDVWMSWNRLTDETGVKLARYVAVSSTIKRLSLSGNQFGEATYLTMAAALKVNTSLQCLYLSRNQAEDKIRIDAAFVETLQVNPVRQYRSTWNLYALNSDDYPRLKKEAEELGHPSLQSMLSTYLLRTELTA
jgi:hypothetical protein